MRSILLHVYDDTGFESRFQAALDLTRAFGGHITCLHATPFEDYLITDPLVAAAMPEEFSTKIRDIRLALQHRIEDRLHGEGVSWDWVHRDELLSTALIRYSMLSDVVVITRADRALFQDEPRPIAAAVAMSARAPVLAIPGAQLGFDAGKPVIIAWNGSPEGAAALRGALPLLQRASDVHLVEVEEKERLYPRDLAARYLSRHDVHVCIVERQADRGDIAAALRSAAAEIGAGLIVMGAFGHSRLREFLLGGVTADLLCECEVPLLLAH
ncbi:universal stress protein [Allosphingosinicella flava]|uniref:Universal stress protein n=1 Tax=Allosphingosinicella flava TaxID=2771430 RepID=A0A7T2GJG2_9SPHN|nr:universal stress protein [Sphingosinicella flava]QPQ54965.1 universal stress protein [Sphingosinicella flava]